jgi:hypothetical protein
MLSNSFLLPFNKTFRFYSASLLSTSCIFLRTNLSDKSVVQISRNLPNRAEHKSVIHIKEELASSPFRYCLNGCLDHLGEQLFRIANNSKTTSISDMEGALWC